MSNTPSAFDRVQTQPDGPGPRPTKTLAYVIAALIAGSVAAWWWWPVSEGGTGDVLVRLTETAASFQSEIATVQPDSAHAFILQELGWSVTPPDLPGLALVGVGLPTVATVRATPASGPADVQLPTFRYEGRDGERAVVFAYDYILLDRVRAELDLPEGTYAGLSEPTPVDSRVVTGSFVVTWRTRAMIFSAITDSEETADRIRQTVAV